MSKTRVLLVGYSKLDPASRYRLLQFIPYLELLDYSVSFVYFRPSIYLKPSISSNRYIFWVKIYFYNFLRKLNLVFLILSGWNYDVIWINRTLLASPVLSNIERIFIFLYKDKVIFDFDDGIHLIGGISGERKVNFYITKSKLIFAGNENLVNYSKLFNSQTQLIPTVYKTVNRTEKVITSLDKLTIGWIGSKSTQLHCLPIIYGSLRGLSLIRNDFEFCIVSDERPNDSLLSGIAWRHQFWSEDLEDEIISSFDIGIMPLGQSKFEEFKCGMKLIQYGANEIPSVATPIGANAQIIINGVTGFLAKDDSDWIFHLNQLLDSQELRREMGVSAKERIQDFYSIEKWIGEIDKHLKSFI